MNKKTFLARTSILKHPNGTCISTPLLVPSFSSKGFLVNSKGESELNKIYKIASEYITDSMLISAFDIFYGYIKDINYTTSEITFVDSGGYETSKLYDLSTIMIPEKNKKKWTEPQLKDVYNGIGNEFSVVLVNYDHPQKRIPIDQQIKEAVLFFNDFSGHLHDLLIKPETNDQDYIKIDSILSNIEGMKGFDIIGFTEKELGSSVLKRLINISKIRMAFDEHGLTAPLHIYGSLDPITSILYFIAGAEIFDGVTWLRYGFLDGMACYYSNYGIRSRHIDKDEEVVKIFMMQENISYLADMKNRMETFLLNGDYGVFGKNNKLSEVLQNSINLLKAKHGRGK
ncbi:hypothetical protein FACS189468_1200 [Spirochaetia bacterium]|nr:hypothetical protein FACS189468_1200 [Spirochaetia bacterium]